MFSIQFFKSVMECNFIFDCNDGDSNKKSVRTKLIRKGGKLTRAVYAGLIVCFVPSVLCQGWSRRLTYDEIYNDTDYAQLQHSFRPFVQDFSHITSHSLQDFSHITSHSLQDFSPIASHNNQDISPISNNNHHDFSHNQRDSSHITSHNQQDSSHILNGLSHITSNNHQDFSQNQKVLSHVASHNQQDFKNRDITSYKQQDSHRLNLEEYRGNEIEVDYDVTVSSVIKEPLLVGFSHDPFRYSVPEDDYLKGVRNINPKSIMNKGENRGKRGVLHLYNMMYCATGCEPLSYKGYGCYCGFLGSGRPTDGIDKCCKIHDKCYENIYCPLFTVYFQPYYWKCYRGQPLCALENHNTEHQFINGCAARLCECDRKFAMCVKKYPCPKRRALCKSSPIRLLQNLLMFR